MTAAIRLTDLTFTFAEADSAVLSRVNLEYEPGEFALICGPTGSGKSTLLKALNGLVPHFTSGSISGSIQLFGTEVLGKKPHDFAQLVGYVNQHAENAFVADRVDEEIAFGMEQLGFSPAEMVERIKSAGKLMGLSDIICDNLTELSGGQQQRVAIASALAVGQKILLLDEPTSELDPKAAQELLVELRRLSHDEGITVLLAEHRIERALDLVDSVTVVNGDGTAQKATKQTSLNSLLQNYRMVPPVIELAQRLNWPKLALNATEAKTYFQKHELSKLSDLATVLNETGASEIVAHETLISASSVSVKYGQHVALSDVSFDLKSSTITALIGPNGSGKTSLLWSLQGSLEHTGRVVVTASTSPLSKLKPAQRLEYLAMVPQNASDLLMHHSISDELADSDESAAEPPGTTSAIFATLAARIDPRRHPRDLSHGQQLALALAIQLAKGARVILLDEPTRGLDYESKRQLAAQLKLLKSQGRAILVASHDIEFVALIADEVLQLSNGKVTAQGNPRAVLSQLGDLAPQVWQVTEKFLTVDEALAGVA